MGSVHSQQFFDLFVEVDKFSDYIPVLSTLTNAIHIFQKCVVLPCLRNPESIFGTKYCTHVKQKSLGRSLFLLVPIIGNIIIYLIEFYLGSRKSNGNPSHVKSFESMSNAKQETGITDLIKEHEREIYKYQKSREDGSNEFPTPNVTHSKPIPLIDFMSALSVIPVPWFSSDEGEGWRWGDFIIHFLKDPIEFINIIKKSEPIAIKYFYSMVVFYHPEHNPHYPSTCPILAVTLEQAVARLSSSKGENPLFLGMYHQGGLKHTNHGEYQGSTEARIVKQHLFKLVSEYLGVTGLPQKIGTLQDTIQFFNDSLEVALKQGNEGVTPDVQAQHEALLYNKEMCDKLFSGKLSKEEAERFDSEMAASLREKVFPPIENILVYPTMAAPLFSIDEGELWEWDELLCILQKKPKTVLEVHMSSYPSSVITPSMKCMTYHYAMTVCLPPIQREDNLLLSVGVEQLINGDLKGAIYLGMFNHSGHKNLGQFHYDETVDVNQIRSKFMEIIKDTLQLGGEPKKLGTIPDFLPNVYELVKEAY